ncbi:MAG: sialate O-acetylesterase [Planctomycetota bacterium]|nr:sialate O-acetylesterase [Planctomycetota bacterium]
MTIIRSRGPLGALALSLVSSPALAEVELPAVFSDHMVLQRDLPVPVWGTADPGETVSVRFGDQSIGTAADPSGAWRVDLAPMPASAEARSLVVEGRNTIEIRDVLVGEVWICGGQSNMEWPVNASSDPAKEKQTADRPTIRLIKAPHVTANRPMQDIAASWTVCSPETVGSFTAVGYAFARHLQDELDVPVGLLSINWGGTRIEPWISPGSLGAAELSGTDMQSLAADIEAFESMSEGERFDAEERAMLEHRRSTASYIDRQLAAGTGLQEKVISTRFDDGDWATVELPKPWSQTDPALRGFDGAVWYRRTIDVPEDWKGRNLLLELGRIDDSDIVWFDGVRIGSTVEAHARMRKYRVRGPIVKPGPRTITVLCIDSGGEGGFGGPANAMKIGVIDRRAANPASIDLAGTWRWERGAPHQGPRPRPAPSTVQAPGTRHTDYAALNNAMIQPFVPFGVRGAIWYQGESNAGEPARYAEFMPMLVADWAADFERTEMPFGIVQLAAFKPFKADQPVEDDWPRLRAAQSRTAADLDHVGIVVTTDIGDAADIHPRNKREVGRRLADWALADHYGRPNDRNPSPRVVEASTMAAEPGVVRLVVEPAAGGLTTRGGEVPDGFALQGPSGRWHWAEAAFGEDGRSILVRSDVVPRPVAVAYAWQNNPERANVTGSSGLPLDQVRIRLD